MTPSLDTFWAGLAFEPDQFQVEAAEAVAAGNSVVVTAPTGSGKTLVAEAAIHLALEKDERVFYTAPVKALSNQKYADLVGIYGRERVGLLTGDNVINGDAEVVVMTTEVLRNMIYAESRRLSGVSTVILDEVHYLQDRSRGAVWEEVIIHCPRHVKLVCLSATVSNNLEFAEWVEERRGPTRLIATSHRPVPLESMYMLKDKMGSRNLHLFPAFVSSNGSTRPNPRIESMMSMERGRRRRFMTPNRVETVELLAEQGMLPAIYFVFSRAGCDAAASRLVDAGLRLTDSRERAIIREIVEVRTGHISDGDLDVLDYDRWALTLELGVAAHHAGLIPAFKETVEELFERGLLKVVFATETLALGINMPARTVVLESLSKFNGENHETIRPGDYTQLTGRAGRRGIDVEGFGVVLHSPYVRFSTVAGIAASGSHPLRSSFRPTYNMTANLIANYDRERAEELLEASFASFQRLGDRHASEATIEKLEKQLDIDLDRAECEMGSVAEYLALVDSGRRPQRDDRIASNLRPGNVVDIAGGARDGRFLIMKRLSSRDGGLRYLVLSTSGRVSTLGNREIVRGSKVVADIDLPGPVRTRDRRFLEESRRRLRRVPSHPRPESDRSAGFDHPVASCPDRAQHLEAARRVNRTLQKLEQLRGTVRSAGHGLVDEFRSIHDLLGEMGYANGWALTEKGAMLRGLYNESDLLVAETVNRGLLDGLSPSELAAFASVFVYEPRSDVASAADWPTGVLAERWVELESLWKGMSRTEQAMRLPATKHPDPGFGVTAFRWAEGDEFDDLPTKGMAPGDFVRVSRQLTDLLRQLREIPGEVGPTARSALRLVDRGFVAAQGVG